MKYEYAVCFLMYKGVPRKSVDLKEALNSQVKHIESSQIVFRIQYRTVETTFKHA